MPASHTLNKTVLITGAATRIGAHLARGLADEGWSVAVHYNRSHERAQTVVSDIKGAGGTAVSLSANLFVPLDVEELMGRAQQALGAPICALINNASTFAPDSAQTMNRASLDHHMHLNLYAPLILARQMQARLPEGELGAIINVLDQRVLKPNPLYFTYSLSKSALFAATQTMAQSFAPSIRVNAIGPGPTLKNKDQSPAEFKAEAAATLLETGSSPNDILEAALYLLRAKSVSGQMIAVDGGQHLTWRTPDVVPSLKSGKGLQKSSFQKWLSRWKKSS